MKKLSYLIGIMVIGGMLFSACSKDDDDDNPPTDVKPTMNFKGGIFPGDSSAYVSTNTTLETNQLFWVGVNANENSSSKSNLTNFKVVRKFEDDFAYTVLDSTFNESSFTLDMGVLASHKVGTDVWTFTITDKDGESAVLSFTITTEAAAATIATYEQTILGSYDINAPNSSFASVNGTTYNMTDAAANSEKIDWIYFDGQNYGNTLIAPDDDLVLDVFGSVANWTTRNATRFATTTLSASQFDEITDAVSIVEVAQNANLSHVSETGTGAVGMAVGDVFAFKTASEKMGVIKITNIEQGATNALSEITFDVKVQL